MTRRHVDPALLVVLQRELNEALKRVCRQYEGDPFDLAVLVATPADGESVRAAPIAAFGSGTPADLHALLCETVSRDHARYAAAKARPPRPAGEA